MIYKARFKATSFTIIICILLSILLSACDISSKHLEKHYDEYINESIQNWDNFDDANVITWDNASIQTFDDVDDYTDWAYSTILFNDITDDYPVIDCQVMDYRSSGEYFDGELIYEMVNDEFDVNSFVAHYAVGTGVIVVCVIMSVATAGSSSVVACFFAGAADSSVSYAIKGDALASAIAAVTTAIKTDGDWETTLYGTLEAGSEGYMWGAIWGAVTGGWNSAYCFTEDTLVQTDYGNRCIKDVSVGDCVLSFNLFKNEYCYSKVTQVNTNNTNQIVRASIGGEVFESTANHPYLTRRGWIGAADLNNNDYVYSVDGLMRVTGIETETFEQCVCTYNLCIADSHTFIIGDAGVIVHNACRTAPNQQYADRRVHFDDPDWIADHPKKTPEEWQALAEKYPNGIYFKPKDINGISHPDFAEYAQEIVVFEQPSETARAANTCLNGNWNHDSTMADRIVGIDANYRETNALTWNHNEDMTTLELIPKDLHNAVRHNGGASLLTDFFEDVA